MTAIHIKALEKTYAGGFRALHGIDLTIERGEFFALLGSNGAGKSTTIGILSSLVTKTAGEVNIFGYDLDRNPNQVKSSIGLVPQEFNFNQFEPVEEIIMNQAGYYGIPRTQARKRTQELLELLSLTEKRRTIARQLSGGMKRRMLIARALVHRPPLLILDEPTAGVDVEIRRSMWQFLQEINQAGTTIILTTHYLEEAEQLCRRVAIINHGRIVHQSSIADLLGELRQETFVLDLAQPLQGDLPVLHAINARRINERSIELDVPYGAALNDIFAQLSAHQIQVLSMRNKRNRLEEVFMKWVEQE